MGIHIYIYLDLYSDAAPSEVCFLRLRVCVLGRGGGHGRAFQRVVFVTSFGNDHIHLEPLPGRSVILCHFAFGHLAVLCLTYVLSHDAQPRRVYFVQQCAVSSIIYYFLFVTIKGVRS